MLLVCILHFKYQMSRPGLCLICKIIYRQALLRLSLLSQFWPLISVSVATNLSEAFILFCRDSCQSFHLIFLAFSPPQHSPHCNQGDISQIRFWSCLPLWPSVQGKTSTPLLLHCLCIRWEQRQEQKMWGLKSQGLIVMVDQY